MRVFYLEDTEWINGFSGEKSDKTGLGYELAGKLRANSPYIASKLELELLTLAAKHARTSALKIITLEAQDKLFAGNKFTELLGNHDAENERYDFDDFVERFENGKTIKICFTIPFGRALGDTVIFFSVVAELRRRIRNAGRDVEFHLITISPTESVEHLFRRSNLFSSISYLPYSLDDLKQFDACIDFIRNHLHIENTWIDSLFELCGIRPETVPAQSKRYDMKPDSEVLKRLSGFLSELRKEKGKPLIIFHREASTAIRSIPLPVCRSLLTAMSEISDYHFVSLKPLDFDHPCFTDISHLSTDLDHYISLVSLADGFITIDTSLYHFADAVGTPGVTIFTTTEPFRFAAYYPSIKKIQLAGADELGTIYWSNEKTDIAFVDGLWSSMKAEALVELLQEAITGK